MRKIGSPLCGAIAAALIGIATLAPALAQQAQTAGITFDLFPGDSTGAADLDPGEARRLLDAARQAQTPEGCPLGRITIFVPAGDAMFQNAMGNARRAVVLQFLDLNGIDPSRFFADVVVWGGDGPGNDAQLETYPRDGEPPRLRVTSMPEKGTKVRTGQRITVKAIANDDANRWQTGIKSIDLTAEGGGPFGFQDYSPPATTCERPPPPRTLEGVYRVPDNPRPIVRLRATAKDFANNETNLGAEYPTGDWYGTIIKVAEGGGHNHRINVDFAFEVDASGTIKGRAHARISTEAHHVPDCSILWTYEPSEFDIPISGRRDGENFEIALEPGPITATVVGCGQSNTFPGHLNPAVHAVTKYRIPAQDGATDTALLSAGALPWGVIMTDRITIHQARE